PGPRRRNNPAGHSLPSSRRAGAAGPCPAEGPPPPGAESPVERCGGSWFLLFHRTLPLPRQLSARHPLRYTRGTHHGGADPEAGEPREPALERGAPDRVPVRGLLLSAVPRAGVPTLHQLSRPTARGALDPHRDMGGTARLSYPLRDLSHRRRSRDQQYSLWIDPVP